MADASGICRGCGTRATPDARFCSACGKPIRTGGLTDGAVIPEQEGFTTIREITLAKQLVHFRLESEEQKESFLEALRAIGDLGLAAPFPIRSAFLVRHYERSPFYGEIEGYVYDEPLGPDRLPPSGKCHDIVFWKDLRTKFLGKPAEPATYGRWVLFSREAYNDLKKRLKL
jgi:hypothetical protein